MRSSAAFLAAVLCLALAIDITPRQLRNLRICTSVKDNCGPQRDCTRFKLQDKKMGVAVCFLKKQYWPRNACMASTDCPENAFCFENANSKEFFGSCVRQAMKIHMP